MRAPKHPHPTLARKPGRVGWGRLVLAAIVAATAPVLSACDSLDTFDIFDSKKKLAGERRAVFPEGVPGVASGVPPELVKGYHEPEGGGLDPAKAAAEAAADAKPKKPKPETRPAPQRTASKPAPKPPAQSDPYGAAPTRAAEPAQQQPAPQAATAPWPTAQPQAAWPVAR
jgi:hypothetical protein